MKQVLLGTIFILLSCSSIFSQAKKNKAVFEIVKIPDSTKDALIKFLTIKENTTITGAILVYNLINKKDYNYKDGIYSFRLMGDHFVRRIFSVSKGKLHIFNGYYFQELLPEFEEFIQKADLPTKNKIAYLKAIAIFLSEEYEIEGS